MRQLKSGCLFLLTVCMSWSTIATESKAMSKIPPLQFMNMLVKTGHRLTRGILLNKTGYTVSSCLIGCLDHPQCISFNLLKNDMCQLSSSDLYRDKLALYEDENSQHFYMPSPCQQKQCEQSETCTPSYESGQYTCASCKASLGLEYGGKLPDSVFSASTSFDSRYTPEKARLNQNTYPGWTPKSADLTTSWLQVTLPSAMVITAIASQGAATSHTEWALDFAVKYGMDASSLVEYKNKDGSLKIFKVTRPSKQTPVMTYFDPAIPKSRIFRYVPKTYTNYPTIRIELYGCADA